MKILFVVYTDPREKGYGGQQRTHAIWTGLRAIPGATVKTVVPVAHKENEFVDEENGVYKLCFDRRYTPGWFLERIVRRLIPYFGCSLGCNWKQLHKKFADSDVVVSRGITPVGRFKLDRMGIPLYLDADDIHTLEFDLHTKTVGNSIWRRIQRLVLSRFQFTVYSKSRRIWVPALEHVSLFPEYPFSWLPNIPCPPLPDVANARGDANRLLFVGLMASPPNFMAIDTFLKTYWARLRSDFPQLALDVAGKGLPQHYAEEWARYEGVNILGYVADIRKLYERSLALITPMIMGAGTCIKVLEALRMGRPVISTAQGLRGIPVERRVHEMGLFQYDTYADLYAAICYLREQGEGDRIAMASRAIDFVESTYSQREVNSGLARDIDCR